jgi:hypothetical protein
MVYARAYTSLDFVVCAIFVSKTQYIIALVYEISYAIAGVHIYREKDGH